jgi:ketosteroid isomerase-like protein
VNTPLVLSPSWLLALVLLTPACRPAPPADGAGSAVKAALRPADLAAILKADSAFAIAANSGSLDGIVALYAEDASLLPPNEPAAKGQQAIRQYWGRFLDAYTLRFELSTDEMDGRSDLAYVRGHYTLTASPKAKGGTAVSDQGKFVEVLKRQADGSWRYVIDIFNSDMPAGK